MGDNVVFNDRLAAELGVMRGKCLPHIKNLIAEDALEPFMKMTPSFEDLVTKAAGLITAGGTNKRKAELSGPLYELAPSNLLFYSRRFGSALKSCRYRLLNFVKVKEWHTGGASLSLALSNEDDEAKDNMQKQRSAAAYKDLHALLMLQIVDDMLGDLPDVIEHLGGHGDHVSPLVVEKLIRMRKLYGARADDPTKTITAACATVGLTSAAQVTAAVKIFKGAVVASSKAAASKWDKHVPEAINYLRRKAFYTPSKMPPLPPAGAVTADFYGCYPSELNTELDMEYAEYVAERRKHRNDNPSLWTVEIADAYCPRPWSARAASRRPCCTGPSTATTTAAGSAPATRAT